MKAVIAGGTGFTGRAITNELLEHGYTVSILTRNREKAKQNGPVQFIHWLGEGAKPEEALEGTDVFINLAGESINSGRWTQERKQRILESRITATREIIRIIKALEQKPRVLINASAVGIYPVSETETFTESSRAAGAGFLSNVVNRWEEEALEADRLGIRTVLARFGVILGTEEGALPKMALPYKMGVGGKVGTGRQWLSWIHIHDVARAIRFAAETDAIEGPVNVTAPNPVRMNEFGKTLGRVLHRPHWLLAPEPALKLALGEMSTVVLDGQRVLPEKLAANGFRFAYPLARGALEDLFKK